MKKNRMMRLASVLLVMVLLTTSVISGTFAKYTTSDTANDTARVAAWGVSVLATGTLFGENYVADGIANGNEISAAVAGSVDTSESDDIVAPGTQNTSGMMLSISGAPEVSTKTTVEPVYVTGATAFKTIFLKAGDYGVLVKVNSAKVNADNFSSYYTSTSGGYSVATAYSDTADYYELHDVVTVNADYYPVKFTWTPNIGSAATYTNINEMYETISAAFNGTANAKADLTKSGVITWVWDFESTDDAKKAEYNGADTILGNLKAKAADQVVVKVASGACTTLTDGTDYNLTVDFGVKITVSQVN